MAAISLNEAQRMAVETDAPLLCCACPGSGKTRVLIAKVRHILLTHPNPQIIMTTFSRDAAEEMLERIRQEKGFGRDQLARLTIGNFHSLALRQLKAASAVGKILSDLETRHLIARALHDTDLKYSLDEADALIARCKAEPAFAAANPQAATLTDAYRAHQDANGGHDFTDLLLRANELMAAGQIKPLPATHVLADEFQDIDQMQFDWLMHHLAQQPVATAVGDDDQSIYGFRRSLGYKGMMDFVAATGANIITLDTNYRSTAGIVSAAGKLIAYNADRVAKKVTASRGDGAAPSVVVLADKEDQGLRIVHQLDAICAGNRVPEQLPGQEPYRFGVNSGQAAVLARTNAQLHALEATFRKARVPYLRSGRSFWDAPLLQVYLAMLEAIDRRDGMGLEIGLRWAGIGEAPLGRLIESAGGTLWRYLDPAEALPIPAGCAEVESLVRLGRGWVAKLATSAPAHAAVGPIYGVAAWMSRVMTKTCAEDEEGRPVQGKGRRDIRDLDRLEAARDTLADAHGPLATRIRRARERDNQDIPRVILSTFHASKGLEWDHVILIDVYGGVVPKITEFSSDEELAEERRVFYVAMTRARDSLTLYTRRRQPLSDFLLEAELATASTVSPADTDSQEELCL